MKKNGLSFFGLCLTAAFLSIFYGCCFGDHDPMCDLSVHSFTAPGNTFLVGDQVTLYAAVDNMSAAWDCEFSETSDSTLNRLVISQLGGNGQYQVVWDTLHTQPALAENQGSEWQKVVQFNQAGSYLLEYTVDFPGIVEERSEYNNLDTLVAGVSRMAVGSALGHTPEGPRRTTNGRRMTITVLPDADGKATVEGRPAVEAVSRPRQR